MSTLVNRADELTRTHFGFSSLRPHQSQVLEHVLEGRDCLAVLPTGSGKSLCYALPSIMRPGLVLVISPLIALIRDQAKKFTEFGIKCDWIDSLRTSDERDQVMRNLDQNACQILIVSPERLAREDFCAKLRRQNLQLIAIDEAHCISQWGNHFRPDYRFLGEHLSSLGPAQKLAVTATATERVRRDIAGTLRLQTPSLVWAKATRDNLAIKVIPSSNTADRMTKILNTVLNANGCGIVYAPTRKAVREVHRMLVNARVNAEEYHAGLPANQRNRAHQAFAEGRFKVVIATNAFGLGIDKADIRFVHHAGLPSSLEQYVQEIGRAGRDGLPADCHLMFGSQDFYIHKFMIDKSYPDLSILKRVLDGSRKLISEAMGLSLHTLTQKLAIASHIPIADITQTLEILFREGVLMRLRSHSSPGFGGDEEIMVDHGATSEARLFREYPDRKTYDLAKLNAMQAYAKAASGARAKMIDQYFQGDH